MRKAEDAVSLRQVSERIVPVILDVTDHDSLLAAREEVLSLLKGQKLTALINNAGIAVGGPLAALPLKDFRWQFEVNLFGLLDVTQTFLPLLERGSKIVNISSIAGYVVQPFVGAYAASKHAVEAVSDALRREFLLTDAGIDVVVVQPGNINTPIWEKADEIDLEPYRDGPYFELGQKIKKMAVEEGRKGEEPRRVAETVWGILGRTQNADRYIVSGNWPQEVLMPKGLPPRRLDQLLKKFLS